jgi:hypothetical protein
MSITGWCGGEYLRKRYWIASVLYDNIPFGAGK